MGKERKIAKLRTSEPIILVADMPIEEAIKTYERLGHEDMQEVVPGVCADESLLVGYTHEAVLAETIRDGGNVLGLLAERHKPHHWIVSHDGGIQSVVTNMRPWITVECNSMLEATRTAQGLDQMDSETFIDYTVL